MSDDFTLKVRRFDPADRRLGRHVVHDSRSLRFRVRAADPRTLRSVRHQVHIPILDQENVGSCTGHAAVAALGSAAFWEAGTRVLKRDVLADHLYAVGVYSDATRLDPWPGEYLPQDTGSDGLSVAKVLYARGLIAGYQHATSLEAALSALAERVVIVGSSWLEGMYEPAPDGRLTVAGPNVGGHEYALDELDVENQRVWMRNSWSEAWGVQGRAWMSWADFTRLLADDGDCTAFVPRTEPAPVPTPQPEPRPADERALAAALRQIVDNKTCPAYLRGPATEWLKGR